MRPRSLLGSAAVLTLAACAPSDPVAPVGDAALAASPQGLANRAIPGEYIVVLKDDVRDVPGLARGLAAQAGGRVGFVYGTALKGFSISVGNAQAAEALARNPNVAYVEPDQEVTAVGTQSPATWGIDRIDQRDLPLNNSYNFSADGTGVTAYIVDTGIRIAHTEFGGRAALGADYARQRARDGDCNGHGTHVAGTVGGATYGVAEKVRLVAVRVLDCQGSGTTSGVIAGIDWVAANAVKPAVANMSLGGGASTSLDNAVANAVASGVTFVVAAGNESVDACTKSPARAATAITVGATNNVDARPSFSNFGTCVDLFAPGVGITSAWHTSNTATNTISGTSMASPHVAGVAALYLAGNRSATPAQVASAITANATSGKVSGAGAGSPNRLLFTNY